MNFKSFSKLSEFGIDIDEVNFINKRVAFSNVVYIALPVVYLIFILVDIKSYLKGFDVQKFDQLIVPIEILICGFCLWMNFIKHSIIGRTLFVFSWPILMHILPIYLLKTPSDYYIAYPMGIIFHSVLIQLMFSFKKEPLLFWTLMVLNFLLMVYSSDLLYFFADKSQIIDQFTNDWYYFLDIVLYWLLFNLVTFYVLYIIELYIQSLHNSKDMIKEQKEELNIINENLDAIVYKKTEQLELQNTKLKEYAFYNAHILRAPFCRIQGIVQVLEIIDQNDENRKELEANLKVSINELDEVINQIQQIVNENANENLFIVKSNEKP